MALLDLKLNRLDGAPQPLAGFRGKVLLVVNTASECGFTPQYRSLQALHEKFDAKGFSVLGFPCNDFGDQEPGGAADIAAFCEKNYGVTFPLFEKSHALGPQKAALFKYLTEEGPEPFRGEIKWNFAKFLINREGELIGRFSPKLDPLDASIVAAIEKALG